MDYRLEYVCLLLVLRYISVSMSEARRCFLSLLALAGSEMV
jgi:hypothetical protein